VRRLLFVGSGLSMAMGMHSWSHLLRTIAEHNLKSAKKSDLLELLAKPGNEYHAADYLSRIIGRGLLEQEFVSLIHQRQEEISKTDLIELGGIIGGMGLTGIVTTNWDTLLTKITANFYPLVWPRDIKQLTSALRNDEPFVLYLHGNIDNRPLVITSEDCQRQAATFANSNLKSDNLFATHYLGVVGYSFPDPHIEQALKLASELAGPSTDIRVVLMKKEEAEKFRQNKPLLAQGSIVEEYKDYANFREALVDLKDRFEPSGQIALIPYHNDPIILRGIISKQTFNYGTTTEMREAYLQSPYVSELLDFSAEYLLDSRNLRDINTCGILAVMLSVDFLNTLWKPNDSLLRALNDWCSSELSAQNTSLVGVVEPLVFALVQKGFRATHVKYLDAVITNPEWRVADTYHIGSYYEQRAITQIGAIDRHIRDRRGLLRANDVTRLLNFLEIEAIESAEKNIVPLLCKSIRALHSGGEKHLAKTVKESMERILDSRKKGRNLPQKIT
jgi:hypothetical protein